MSLVIGIGKIKERVGNIVTCTILDTNISMLNCIIMDFVFKHARACKVDPLFLLLIQIK